MQNKEAGGGLFGKVAIVTGASSGIGKAVSRDLARAGVKLVISARRSEILEELREEIGDDVVVVPGEITDPKMPDMLVSKALEVYSSCDIVIHAAGILCSGSIVDVNIEDMCRMVRINVESSVRLTYTVMRHFKKAGAGHFIHLSSILGTKVRPYSGVYAGTKYAIEALTESLRMELAGTDIKISVIEPGVTLTELHDKIPVHPIKALNITKPLQPEDIAVAIRFMLEQPCHIRIPVMMILPGEQSI